MIHWRTDTENAPRDGTVFIIPSPHGNGDPRLISNLYLNVWWPEKQHEKGIEPAGFQIQHFTHWSEINLP